MKMTEQELAKMSEDVFAGNLENKFWATDDGCFFKLERQAREHAIKIESLVFPFEREVTEEVAETELIEKPEIKTPDSVETTSKVPIEMPVETPVEDKSAKPKKK